MVATMEEPGSTPNATPTSLQSPPSDEEYTIVHTGALRKHGNRIPKANADDDEPLIDTTAALQLNSKKTKRLQKQQLKKKLKTEVRSDTKSFLELPQELLEEVLSHLRPSDIFTLLRLNRPTHDFILRNESAIARKVIQRRYWILGQCFLLPYHLYDVDALTQSALLNARRQEMLNLHKKPYQHIKPADPLSVCTCTTCLLAWNNLCLVLDFHHFERHHLAVREPVPMIPRGTAPEWNRALTAQHAAIVAKAMTSPLAHAAILQKHLCSTVATIIRHSRAYVPPKRAANSIGHMLKGAPRPKSLPPRRLYHLTDAEAEAQTDAFLARNGPSSYEFPYHRDNYYNLKAYVPNRKWSKEDERWKYFGPLHEKDLAIARQWFLPAETRPILPTCEIERVVAVVESRLATGGAISAETLDDNTVLPIR